MINVVVHKEKEFLEQQMCDIIKFDAENIHAILTYDVSLSSINIEYSEKVGCPRKELREFNGLLLCTSTTL